MSLKLFNALFWWKHREVTRRGDRPPAPRSPDFCFGFFLQLLACRQAACKATQWEVKGGKWRNFPKKPLIFEKLLPYLAYKNGLAHFGSEIWWPFQWFSFQLLKRWVKLSLRGLIFPLCPTFEGAHFGHQPSQVGPSESMHQPRPAACILLSYLYAFIYG